MSRTCTIARLSPNVEKNQYHSHGVTPMHFAIGAQHHETILLLHNNGASLGKPPAAGKNTPVAPAMYLLLEGWPQMIGCRDPMEVVRIVDVLISPPIRWQINSSLNRDNKTIMDLAMEVETGVPGFKDTLKRELANRGART